MPEDRDQLSRHYLASRRELLAVIRDLTEEQRAAVVDGWAVGDHLSHIVAWDELRASEIGRISAGFESAWRLSDDQGDIYSSLCYEARREHSFEQVLWELESSRERLLDAIAAATERGLDPSHYGEAGLRSVHEVEHTQWLKRYRERPAD